MSLASWSKAFIIDIGQFWQQKLNGSIFRWNIFIIMLGSAYVAYKFNVLPPQIPLFYSRPWGEPELVSSTTVFLPLILSIFILIINNTIAVVYSRPLPLLARLLIIASLLFSAFSVITLYRIISLVT